MDGQLISPTDSHGSSPGNEQQAAGVGILLQIMMLVLSFVIGHVLRRHKVYYLPEASASLLIGLVVGGLANISDTETNIRSWFNFHEEFFFLFLLPPIIFQSGFNLSPKPFFSNFGAIVTFSVLGTFIASLLTGVLVYLGGFLFLMYKLPFLECMMFGALISSTDPVTVLSIFQELGTDVNLYALVFGESVLNDAVAISLYRTLSSLNGRGSSGQNIFMFILGFLETFVGSLSAGVGVGFVSALLFKYAGLDIDNLQNLECCLFVLFPYFSYMLTEGLGLSGIVSILFTGIVMKHYAYSNLSERSQQFVSEFFHLISSLAETFIFIYMGLDIFMEQHNWSHVGFIFFSIIFIVVARAANVFSCGYLVNLARPIHRKIPMKHQKALWYSGLRGAMAFALALQSLHDLPEGHGQTIFTATTAIVVLTVLLIGGTTGTMLEALEVVGDDHDDHLGELHDRNNGYIPPSQEDDASSSGSRFKMKLKEFRKSTTSFTALDKNYLTPFFTTQNSDDEEGELVFLDCSISSMVSNQLILSGCNKKYMVQTVLPTIIPPSYKGATVRYLYYARIALHGQWLIPENSHPNRGTIGDPTGVEARLPLQVWGCHNSNEYLVQDEQSEGIFPSQTMQMDIYWKEMDGDSDWVKANEAYDSVEEDYESSRDEVSSVSSYNPARESLHNTFGSSLSLQSSSSRLHGREILHAEADEVSYSSTGDILSHSKPLGTLTPSRQGSNLKSFSRDDDKGIPAASGKIESAASEGFVRGRSYNIRLDDQVLLRFSPKKSDSVYYFGDTIGGTLTFFHEEGTRRCLEVSITLEFSETVNRRTVHPSRRNSPTITKVHSDYYEVVADLLQTSFLFSIPMDGPMTFSTPHVSVQWALRFEFFTTPRNVDWTRYDHPLLVENRDKCEWVLPITVHAPEPSASSSQSQRRSPSLDPLWNHD